jgi:pimeloyl-ACP methyl ester carboxylesterase
MVLAACVAQTQHQRGTPSLEAGVNGAMPATTGRVSIDVGGFRLRIRCRGVGAPTIVTEAGYQASGLQEFRGLMQPLAAVSRVCAYDRAGIGVSDARVGDTLVTSGVQAAELHSLLAEASVDPPYVLVAHSYGGFIARLFAARYADDTAGLILLESSHEDEVVPYRRFYGGSSAGDWVDGGDLIDIDTTVHELRTTARDFGAMPLIAIRAETYDDVLSVALWRRTQADLATLSADALAAVAVGSGHLIPDQDPQVIVEAAWAIVAAIRRGEALPPCQQIFEAAYGRCA